MKVRAALPVVCLLLSACAPPSPGGGGGATTPAFSGPVTDVNAVPKVDESKLPGGNGKLVRLHEGFADVAGRVRPGRYWSFEVEAVPSADQFTLNRVSPLYMFVKQNGQKVGQNLIATIPGMAGYSPYWQIHRVTVPDSYVPNSIRTMQDVQTALRTQGFHETVMNAAVNCPVVAETTRLEGAADKRADLCWHEGKRSYYFAFDTLPVVNGRVQIAPIWVLMPRDADPMNPNAPNARTTTQPIQNYDKSRANPEPFLNQDQGEGNFELNNNLIDTWPSSDNPANPLVSTPQYPEKGKYSGLWLVKRVNVPDNYSFRSVNTVSGLTSAAGFQILDTTMLVNCPLLETIQR